MQLMDVSRRTNYVVSLVIFMEKEPVGMVSQVNLWISLNKMQKAGTKTIAKQPHA